MDIKIFSLFPEMFTGPLGASLLGKARSKDILNIDVVNFREYSTNKHRSVDDYPFGGGAGMVLQPEPVISALRDHLDLNDPDTEIILMSPQGRPFNQEAACELSKKKRLAFICGHYEGFDERIRAFVTAEYSIGDYVLTGGELPAMVMIDAISRFVPGVLHNDTSTEFESFQDHLLEYPQYTRPEEWHGKKVPEVLLSGHHVNIEKWRREQSVIRTAKRRPDLLEKAELTQKEKELVKKVLANDGEM
jgi:tRNA (guanine37-N1)-methyltransferase